MMQNDSDSAHLLNAYESQKNAVYQDLLQYKEEKNEITQLIQSKEEKSNSISQEIEGKKRQLVNEKPSLLKPIKFLSNIRYNSKIKFEMSRLNNEKKIVQSDIQKSITKLNSIENRIQDISGQINKFSVEISFIQTQQKKGLELFDDVWVKLEDIPTLRETKIGLSNNFENMSPFDFEFFVARLLQEMGYRTEVTKKTGDYGIDIIAKKGKKITAVQCKRHNEKNLVGNKLIQQLLGSMNFYNADQCIFVTTSYYTKNAIKQAQNSPIELWDKDTFHELVKKHLLNHDINQIFTAIENEKLKEREKKQERIAKAEIKKQTEDDKRICPRCGKGKMKTRKYCSKCKKEIQREKRYEYY